MKKIYINKSDTVSVAVHKILSSHDDDIVIYVPRNSVIGGSIKNFKLIKREAAEVGKKISVESIDQDALDYASGAGLSVLDAIFSKTKDSVADIKPVKRALGAKKTLHVHRVSPSENYESEEASAGESEAESSQSDSEMSIYRHHVSSENASSSKEGEGGVSLRDEDSKNVYEEEEESNSRPKFKRVAFTFSTLVVISLAVYLAVIILPKADIFITLTKIPWSDSSNITASASVTSVNAELNIIPAELFSLSKNAVVNGTASLVKPVSQKASGRIVIYNAYSSAPQVLLQNTRFAAPSGKIYRTTAKVTIPGAKISDGKIIPSSFETTVIADAPGVDYNSGPIEKLTIPGFSGTPKFAGFYGELKDGIKGGFVGNAHIATDADIAKVKVIAEKNVSAILKSEVSRVAPPGFKIVDGSASYAVTKGGITSDPDEKGSFTYGVMMEAKIAAFREDDVIALEKAKFSRSNEGDFTIKDQKIEYGTPTLDLKNKKVVIPVKAAITFARAFDSEAFKATIIGKSEGDLRPLIFAVPGVKSTKADLWPIWVRSVPKNADKIKIIVD